MFFLTSSMERLLAAGQRVIEYSDLPPEEPTAPSKNGKGGGSTPPNSNGDTSPGGASDGKKGGLAVTSSTALESWPTRGTLVLRDVVLQYAPELPPVLRGVSLRVEHGQRVGIVGRVRYMTVS